MFLSIRLNAWDMLLTCFKTSELATKEITELLDTYRVIDDESFMLADFLLKHLEVYLQQSIKQLSQMNCYYTTPKRVELLKKIMKIQP